jgi:thiamine phosphate synthase YjbQ (UPF0047 family)
VQQTLTLTTSKRLELIDITRQVEAVVTATRVEAGLCSGECWNTTRHYFAKRRRSENA